MEMDGLTPWFLLLFVGVTALLTVLSAPLMWGWVKPNPLYGVRTTKTLGDEKVWYQSNAYGGRLLFYTGFALLTVVVALYFVPSLRGNFVAYNLACGAAILCGLLTSSALIWRHLQSL
jgi:uncharacterized membrane protein